MKSKRNRKKEEIADPEIEEMKDNQIGHEGGRETRTKSKSNLIVVEVFYFEERSEEEEE